MRWSSLPSDFSSSFLLPYPIANELLGESFREFDLPRIDSMTAIREIRLVEPFTGLDEWRSVFVCNLEAVFPDLTIWRLRSNGQLSDRPTGGL